MRHSHCLVPAKGYYEWKGPRGNKTPYLVELATNAPGFCMAGLYTRVSLPDFQGYSYTILTEAATGALKELHARVPVMLDESSYQNWAAGAALQDMPRMAPGRIKITEVGTAVGKVGNDGPELVRPV